MLYRDQEQPEVTHLGQHPVQGGLIGDRAADDGFLPVAGYLEVLDQVVHRRSRMPLTRIS